MIVAESFNLHTFANAFRFLWDDRSFVATKALEHIELSAIAIGIGIVIALPLGGLARPPASRLVPRDQRLESRPGAPESRGDLGRAPGLWIGHTVVILALIVLAAPLILTNSYVGVDPVEAEVVEAARGWASRRSRCSRASSFPLPCRSSSRESHGCRLRRRDRDAGGCRGWRVARRHHLQPGDVLSLWGRRRGHGRLVPRVLGVFLVCGTAALAHPSWLAPC